MRSPLASMKRAVRRFRSGARVADESVLAVLPELEAQQQRRNAPSLIREIARLPLALLSCATCDHQGDFFAGEHPSGWPDAGGEAASRISEINHLMVRDSMRYAIFV